LEFINLKIEFFDMILSSDNFSTYATLSVLIDWL
jgi:hypothetical protein